ncbi:MAG: class I SAM-dependent rRNA methyltransferase [Puniceicoccales bacterium]|jgi:23S rRNA (cytosine1962-C5)-methyltransferase|nr:class I SAM-dependent rRNA methyltransferase [Puniceicoccales bacterium]
MKSIRLHSPRPCRALAGHPWAFAGEIDRAHAPIADGEAVELFETRGFSLGAGLWSNRSQISWRRYARRARPFDAAFIGEALDAALARRDADGDAAAGAAAVGVARRLVWSEADNLPGLVLDQFGGVFAAQALTAGADRALPDVRAWIERRFSPREIIFRNDAPVREREGLPLEVRTVSGKPFAPDWFRIGGVEYFLDLQGGQKTGFYLDQREQHLRVARLAKGRRVLDAFCNQGGFALQAARAGAADTLGIDSSPECIATAERNALRNGLAGNTRFLRANVFDWFTENRDSEPRFDLIILDPPPFARSKDAMAGAMRGYKEINLRALKLLTPGGLLATYSCSQRVGVEDFLAMLAEAASDARRETRVLEVTNQPPDHPVLLNFPESHYLKGAILRAE